MVEARAVTAYFLGGTIGMAGHRRGVVSRLEGKDLVAAVPQLADLAVDLEVREFRQLPSACLTFADVVALAEDAAATSADGVVVVQGTDTIEETSYLLDLLWPHDTPLVVTGAMRNPTLAGPDGPANLVAAVATAASPRARGQGVLVVLNDRIHAARFVRKTHSTDVATFESPDTGPLGMLVEGVPVLLTQVPRRSRFEPAGPIDARVPVLTVTLDQDPASVTAAAAGCHGLVVAGFGVGHVPEWLAGPLGEVATRKPVVLASRTVGGPVLSRTYGFAGSETDLRSRGLIGAGLLDPYKARVLLRVALACGYDVPAIAAAFDEASALAEPGA